MTLKKVFLITILLIGFCFNTAAQDSLTIDGITIAPDDSLKARQILQDKILPNSEFWTKAQEGPGNYSASNLFVKLTSIAYPIDSPKFRTEYVDSIFSYITELAQTHENINVRAEFLYKGLKLATQIKKEHMAKRYHSTLTAEHAESQYASRAEEYAPEREIQVGRTVPDFILPALEDTTQTLSNEDFRNQIYLVDIWGTWCGPCLREMPYLHEAYEKYQAKGFTIFSIAIHDKYDAVKTFREKDWPMPWNHSFIENDSSLEDEVVSKFEVYSVPKTFLVNRKGKIIATDVDLRGERLLSTLEDIFDKR